MSSLPKPVLRGHIKRRGIKSIIGGLAVAVLNGSLYYFLVKVPRENAHVEFLKTYDGEAHVKDLIKWGYLQTVKKEEEE